MSILGRAAKLAVACGTALGAYALIKKGAEPHEEDVGQYKRPCAGTGDAHLDTLRKHWSNSAVITDDYTSKTKERNVPEEDLLPGELSATTFQIGCYMVRSAQRLYSGDLEVLASDADIERYKKAMTSKLEYEEVDDLQAVHEVSARHCDSPGEEFVRVCRAMYAKSWNWSESIEAICAVKERASDSNASASLFVLSTYVGSSFDVDKWFKLDPDGEVTMLELHPYDENLNNARFE